MSGHTKGRVEADGNGVHLLNGQCVALTHMEPKERRDADAALIAEAFNVAAWRAADGPTRAAFLSQVMRKEAA